MTDTELASLVAERVMGWRSETHPPGFVCRIHFGSASFTMSAAGDNPWRCWNHGDRGTLRTSLPDFVSNIAAAWKVVERMQSMGWFARVVEDADLLSDGRPRWWEASFETEDYDAMRETGTRGVACAKNAPRAICEAALKALGHEVTVAP